MDRVNGAGGARAGGPAGGGARGMRGAAGGANLLALRSHNTALVLDLLRTAGAGGISRLELAERTGLTPQAVSKITARLRAEGLAADAGRRASTGGKPRTVLRLVPGAGHALGVHLDRDELRAVLTDLDGTVIAERRVPLDLGAGAGTVVETVARAAEDLTAQALGPRGTEHRPGPPTAPSLPAAPSPPTAAGPTPAVGGSHARAAEGPAQGGDGTRAAAAEGGATPAADGPGTSATEMPRSPASGERAPGGRAVGGSVEGEWTSDGPAAGEPARGGRRPGRRAPGGPAAGEQPPGEQHPGEQAPSASGEQAPGEAVSARLEAPGGEGPWSVGGGLGGVSGLLGLGVALPGPLDHARGVLHRVTGFPEWDGFPLRDALERRLGVPVVVDKDTNAAALGLALRGDGGGSFAYLHLGTGLGAGLVFGGTVHRGARTGAGEFGHQVLQLDGPPCTCGARGCTEALCLAAVARGDLAEAARVLGTGAANLAGLLDIDLVLLGGRTVAAAPEAFVHGVGAVLDARARREGGHDGAVPVRLAPGGTRAVAEGAAQLLLAPLFGRGDGG
ncbi:ROK family protein [Streptomyces ardesiacus]|uniref:ROK family protein n=1 Tax=Streptomyces ardesiacus TaxID=285564 RepID=A0ABW8HBQ0_9ACTN